MKRYDYKLGNPEFRVDDLKKILDGIENEIIRATAIKIGIPLSIIMLLVLTFLIWKAI